MSSSDEESTPQNDESTSNNNENKEESKDSSPDISKLKIEDKNSPEARKNQERQSPEGSDNGEGEGEGEGDEDFEEDTETLNTKMATPLKSTIKEMTANIRENDPSAKSPLKNEDFAPIDEEAGDNEGGEGDATANEGVTLKVAMIGDAAVGKTSLMVKYVEDTWDEDYVGTLGVNFLEKVVTVRGTEVTFSIWDLGGQREFMNMLPLVCNEAAAILFMFDLTRLNTLNSVKEWYRQARAFNKSAVPLLIGTKYDQFASFPHDEQAEITELARKFAKAMGAPLLFCSASHSINVQKIFKIVLAQCFGLKCKIPKITKIGTHFRYVTNK